MSGQGAALACGETRLTIAINGARELIVDLESLNHRLATIKGRLFGEFDDCDVPPSNTTAEPERPVIQELEHMLNCISVRITEAKRHTATLEEL